MFREMSVLKSDIGSETIIYDSREDCEENPSFAC